MTERSSFFAGTAAPPTVDGRYSHPFAPVRHSYPLAVRDAGLGAAVPLLLRTLPYALARLGLALAFALVTLLWAGITFGGAAWLGEHVAGPVGVVWLVGGLILFGGAWYMAGRYVLHLVACGHVAVLTDLIVFGRVRNGPGEGMLAYGLRAVKARFGEASALFALNALVRGVVDAFNRALEFLDQLLPLPGLEGLVKLVEAVLRMATAYLDKAIFSYNLARGDENPWRSGRDGLVYYCQNAKPILEAAVWVLLADVLLTVVLWLVMLLPSIPVALLLPLSLRTAGSIVYLLIAALLAWAVRGAFLKPLFLVMITVRFHALIEGQPINEAWDARLSELTGKFDELKRRSAAWDGSRPATAAVGAAASLG